MNKISTKKYLFLRHEQKLDFLKISKNEVDRLSDILQYSIEYYTKLKIEKKSFKIYFNPSISIINQYFLALEKINLENKIIKDENIVVPLDLNSLRLLYDKSFILLNSINKIKNLYVKKIPFNMDKIKIYNQNKKINFSSKIKIKIIETLNFLFNFRKTKIILDLFNLKLYLKIFIKGYAPQFISPQIQNLNVKYYDLNLRKKIFEAGNKFNLNDDQKKSWFVLIYQLPISLIENFEHFFKKNSINQFNINKLILSNIRKSENELKLITKSLENKSTNLEIYQGGFGPFFIKPHYFSTQFEYEIADKYYNWSRNEMIKCKQIPLFRKFNVNLKNIQPVKKILLINNSWPFFQKFGTQPAFEATIKNFDDQIKFLNIIKNGFHEIIIKNQPYEHEMFNKYEIYKKNKLEKYISNKKLNFLVKDAFPVCSYLGTPFLEFMANDIPFITFFRPSQFSSNSKANYYLQNFKKFNFIYYNPKNAANYILNHKDHLIEQWREKEFVKLRNEFKNEFCNSPKDWQNNFLRLLNL